MNPMTNYRPGHAIARAIIFVICLAAFLSLFGCSSGDGGGEGSYDTLGRPTGSWCYTTYGYDIAQYDDETMILLHPTLNEVGDFYAYIPFEEMVEEYKDVEACMVPGAQTPGPSIMFNSFEHFGFPFKLALYNYGSRTAWIDTDIHDHLPARNCISDREFLRHEFGHHILAENGEDSSHANRKFETCDAFGPKTCNGEYCKK